MSSKVSTNFSLICCLLIFFCSHSSIVDAKIKGFTVDIVHRHSKLSPFYNQSAAQKSEKSSTDNLSQFNDEKTVDWNYPNGIGDYIMKIYIGTPPVETYAIADTGSDLVWLQCAPCQQCYYQDLPLFEPTLSYTYGQVSCSTGACQTLSTDKYRCGSIQNECIYNYAYGDQTSYTRGFLSTETISMSLGSPNSFNGLQRASYPGFVFGCGHQNEGRSLDRHGAGIIGLNRGPLSLISQLGFEKFSYCLQPPSSNSLGKMAFGDDAGSNNTNAVSTPLLTRPDWEKDMYYVNLEGASVNGTTIVHKQSNTTHGNILLDSGTLLTYLESEFRDSLEAAVRKAIPLTPAQSAQYSQYESLCYMELPEIEAVFHFTNANVTLKPLNMFEQNGERFCFTMMPVLEGTGQSIYGNTAHRNFEIGHDLANKLISFAPSDCAQSYN